MGIYIQGPNNTKVEYLIKEFGAVKVDEPVTVFIDPKQTGMVLICVVDNIMFDAAAICFSPTEFKLFTSPDERYKTWLLMEVKDLPTDIAEDLKRRGWL